MSNLKKIHIGKKFGKLVILDQIPGKKCICLCDCGKEKIFHTNHVITEATKSCGCIRSIKRDNYIDYIKEKIFLSIKINANGCWEWQKSRHKQGYGNLCYKRTVHLAHRISWIVFNGEINKEILVLHKCDNPPCCNPDHLFLGTDRDNIIDAFSKGRIERKKGEDHYNSKLTNEIVLEIKKLYKQGVPQKQIAKILNVNERTVNGIASGNSWKHI